jgi:drug/metabolite transporter (DMT)-like permease
LAAIAPKQTRGEARLRSRITRGHLSAFFTIFIWGTTFVATKVLLKSFTPVEIVFFRLVLAYLFLWIISPQFVKFRSLKEELTFAGAGLCGVTLFFLFQNTALSYTQAANVSVLISVAPFFTAILSRLILKDEELHLGFFIGFALAIVGIGLVSYTGNTSLQLNPFGDLLAICCAGVWAIYSISMKKISLQCYETIPCTRKIFFYGLLFLLPALPFFGFRLGLERLTHLPNLLNLLFLGIGASALCFVTWNYALGILGTVRTSVYIYAVPVITILFAVLLLGERLTAAAALGVFLILAGLYLSERRGRKVRNDP